MLTALSLALAIGQPARLDGYAPVKNAFAQVVESIKAGQGSVPLTFYTGTSLVGGLIAKGHQLVYTIAPANDASLMAYVGKDGADKGFKIEVTSGGQNALSDSNEYGGVFSVQAHKAYKISVTNTGARAYVGIAIMWVGKEGASHHVTGITKAVDRMAQAMEAGISQGYKIPVNRDSLQGVVLTSTHRELTRPLFAGKDWMAVATCDGAVGDLKLSLHDEKKAILTESENTDDVCAVVYNKPVPHGGFTLTSPKTRSVLTVSSILVKD